MDNPLDVLRAMVLVVLAGPLVAALAVGLLGRLGTGPARRTAAGLAALHLGLTGLLAWSAASLLGERDHFTPPDSTAESYFKPIGVPGDLSARSGGQSHETGWTLLSISPPIRGLPAPAVQLYLGVDGLNVWLVVLTSLMTLIAVWVSWGGITERAAGFYAWIFVLEAAVIGAFLAFDVVLFYAFFELTLIPAFFLIGHWGVGGNRRAAAAKFFLYTLFGSLFTLVGLVGIVLTNPTPYVDQHVGEPDSFDLPRHRATYNARPGDNGTELEIKPGPITFSVPRLMQNVRAWADFFPRVAGKAAAAAKAAAAKRDAAKERAAAAPTDTAAKRVADQFQLEFEQAERAKTAAERDRDGHRRLQIWFFFAVMAGFAVKTPIVPFHTWLPAAYAEAPAAVTMLLSAVLAKLGTYGILRVVLPLCPDAAFEYGLPVFGFLGAAGIVYGALCAYAQRDLKLLVAYSSVSHLGLLVLGLFTLNREGLSGATLHMVNHGLSTGAMFAMLAFLVDRHRTLDMSQYGGLIGRYPAFAALFFVVALAGVGLPGLNNFVSEMLILAGLFDPIHTASMGYGLVAAAAFGVFLSAWYTMTMLRKVFFGPAAEPPTAADSPPPTDLTGREALAFGVPALLCLVLGLYPQPLLDTMKPDVNVIVVCGNQARERAGYPPTSRGLSPAEFPPVQPGRGQGR
ncbi:MAG: complex I subunit 4 family protein [Fimbriiglobus sp.]